MSLIIDPNQYYNLVQKEGSYFLLAYKEALILLYYLESQNIYIAINKQYILDKRGVKKDRVILYIAWWTLAQI